MKRIWSLIGSLIVLAAHSQTVNISVQGNRNERIIVNNVTYDIDNNTTNNLSRNITLNNLRPGEYSLQLTRINDYNVTDDKVPVKDNDIMRMKTTTTFTVRSGYDVAVVIYPNGIIQVKDKPVNQVIIDPTVAMSDSNFNILLSDIQFHWRNTRRITAAQTALTNNNNYFSTQQVMQILETVEGDANRLTLAKLAYNRITDPDNFTQVYSIMLLPASRDDLSSFIRQPNGSRIFSYSESFRLEMSEATLEAFIEKLKLITDKGIRANKVTEIVTNTTNYFTVAQIRRLIELVDQESIRLQLLKSVYSHITDPENFNLLYSLLTTDETKFELYKYVQSMPGNVVE